jgi:hypothetical protein
MKLRHHAEVIRVTAKTEAYMCALAADFESQFCVGVLDGVARASPVLSGGYGRPMKVTMDRSVLIGSSAFVAVAALVLAASGITLWNGDSAIVLGLLSLDYPGSDWVVVVGVLLLLATATAPRWRFGDLATLILGLFAAVAAFVVRRSLLHDVAAINDAASGGGPPASNVLTRERRGPITSVEADTVSVGLLVIAIGGLIACVFAAIAMRTRRIAEGQTLT